MGRRLSIVIEEFRGGWGRGMGRGWGQRKDCTLGLETEGRWAVGWREGRKEMLFKGGGLGRMLLRKVNGILNFYDYLLMGYLLHHGFGRANNLL